MISLVFPFPLGFLVAQTVNSLPAVQESWVRSLGREDPLEKEMATRAWKIPRRRSLVGYPPWSHKESDPERLHFLSFPFLR